MMSPESTNGEVTVCIFVKPPVPGEVKTRLIPLLGRGLAAAFAAACLRDTWSAAQELRGVRRLIAVAGDPGCAVQLQPPPEVWTQGEGDLGQRMARVLGRALQSDPAAIALGTDSPGLPPALVQEAQERIMNGADAVLGPAEDGGFYLLALRRCPPALLDGLPWSQADTMSRTHHRLLSAGLKVESIPPWFDVDQPEDLLLLRSLLGKGHLQAPETGKLLARLPDPLVTAEVRAVLARRELLYAPAGSKGR